jgi:radical SAM family RiPP maturation amino acid epimerase
VIDAPTAVDGTDHEWYREARTRLCHFKRFVERWKADDGFRRRLRTEPDQALAQHGLEVEADVASACADLDLITVTTASNVDETGFPETLREYRRLEQYRRAARHWTRQNWIPANPRFRAWRERQIARSYSELGRSVADELDFGTANYELSQGCSVGCWFCGLSAPRLADIFLHTSENARLWREVVEVMLEICGPQSAQSHILYWATDPLDNPDFEEFWLDFRAVVGVLPHTTTALPLKNANRTRAFLDLRRRYGGFMDRFSILSLKILDRLHAEFDAEELSHVQCSLVNSQAVLPKANAGRFRDRALSQPAILQHEADKFRAIPMRDNLQSTDLLGSTICCQAGFSLNMVRRHVRLISPCRANDRWPDGTVVHGQASFRDAKELRKVILELIDHHMTNEVGPRSRVRFRTDLRYESLPKGFQLSSHLRRRLTFTDDNDLTPYVVEFGRLLRSGRYTAEEMVNRLMRHHTIFPDDSMAFLNRLFSQGLLSEDPELDGRFGEPDSDAREASTPLAQAIDAAVTFLLDGQQPDGCWNDIQLDVGGSTEWVTGFVAYALQEAARADDGNTRLDAAIHRARTYLMNSRHRGGGWGFNQFSGVDADSTSTCLLFLLGHDGYEQFAPEIEIVRRNQNADGGFGTFSDTEIAAQMHAGNPHFSGPDVRHFRGWCSSDSYVTAMSLLAFRRFARPCIDSDAVSRALAYMKTHQSGEGHWTAYWSTSKLLATHYCARALSEYSADDAAGRLRKVCDWIVSTEHQGGGWAGTIGSAPTPLDTALAIETLVVGSGAARAEHLRRGIEWLADEQMNDGSFESYDWMKVPAPWEGAAESEADRHVSDARRYYTTAAVLRSLLAARSARMEESWRIQPSLSPEAAR